MYSLTFSSCAASSLDRSPSHFTLCSIEIKNIPAPGARRWHPHEDQCAQLPRHGDHLQNGGKVEVVQQMAGHESARTTGLYGRRNDSVALGEVERIAY